MIVNHQATESPIKHTEYGERMLWCHSCRAYSEVVEVDYGNGGKVWLCYHCRNTVATREIRVSNDCTPMKKMVVKKCKHNHSK